MLVDVAVVVVVVATVTVRECLRSHGIIATCFSQVAVVRM